MAAVQESDITKFTDEQLDEKIQKLTRIAFSGNWNLASQARPILMMYIEEQSIRNAKKFEEHLEKNGVKIDEIINIG